MRFDVAYCEGCGKAIFEEAGMVPFRRSNNHAMKIVALGGENPWVGVRAMCLGCCRFFADALTAKEAEG